MLTGDRRWASSARRGGMTVLGKVAVPKPINLPSQRLENQGNDPNVEIVPKGTHSWGSRSSSSTTNAWGSSSPSANNDGSGSPSYLSGRPSSGGSGTRPSTAGSDRVHEPNANANAWGSNSRPSSASGALSSNQASLASLRPRSAETRPGSSQLSRFAEPLSDNLVAWGSADTAEKLGVTSSKNDGFSLTSGDFPTLGSEKEASGKSSESQDRGSHGRPSSSSGGEVLAKEMSGNSAGDATGNSNARNGSANSWRRDNHMYGEDAVRSNVETWHSDPQPYSNTSMPPQQYDAWHGPPVNSHPAGVWYRGPPGGPPFGPPVGPGGFPMEPFPYYRPQIPPGALANPQPVPPPGAGPRGPHPKNGDMFRPRMHDTFMRPGMPIRPGFFPGPVPYDNYYGPPMGYCNSNERDIPFMGMPMGPATPAAYNRYSGQNAPDPGNSNGRSSAYGSSGKGLVSEQMEAGHPQDARVPHKVILKQHDGWEGRDEQKWDDTVAMSAPYSGKRNHQRKSSWENGWRTDHKEEEVDTRRTVIGEEASSELVGNREGDSAKVESHESLGHSEVFNDSSVKKLEQNEQRSSVFPDASSVLKEPSLIQKIEGLNAKARASDSRQDDQSVWSRDEQKSKLQDGTKNHSVNEAGSGSAPLGNSGVNPSSHEDHIFTGEKSLESMVVSGTTTSRRSPHGVRGRADQHGRADHRGRGRFNAQETDGWRKKSQVTDSPILVAPTVPIENSVVHGPDLTSFEGTERSGSHSQGKDGDMVPLPSDPSDSQSQRAKMRELARQRFLQREKEEEERERDQKAKARAKLEELNRRTQAGEKLESVPSRSLENKQDESSSLVKPTEDACQSKGSSPAMDSNQSAVIPTNEILIGGIEISSSFSSNVLPQMVKTVQEETLKVHNQSEPVHQLNNSDSTHRGNDLPVHDSNTSKQKRISYKQKLNNPLEKSSTAKPTSSLTTESSKGDTDVVTNAIVPLNCEPSLHVNQNSMSEASVHHKKKNRSTKNKHKVEEASSIVALPSKDTTALETTVESSKIKTSEPVLDPISVQAPTDSKDADQSSEQHTVLPNEEAHLKVNNQWKAQHPRRTVRNQHPNKSTEKFQSGDAVVWAPVRLQNKNEVSDEASEKTAAEIVTSSTKNDQQVQNNPRNKRAEKELYIPKPAKEMAQQGSGHQAVPPPINQTTSDESIGKSECIESSQTSGPVASKGGSTMESRNGDSRQNKSGRVHGAWRQRGGPESTSVTSHPSRNVQKPTEHQQHHKPDLSSAKEQSRHNDEWNASDGWNIPEKPNASAAVPVPTVNEQGVTVRGKRQSYKGYKGTGYHHLDEKRINSGDTEKAYIQSSTAEMNQAESHLTSKENRSVGDRSASHWQPKANTVSATNEQGSKSNNSQDLGAEVGRVNKKESTPQRGVLPPSQERAPVKAPHHHDQSLSEASLAESQGVGHQENKRGRKPAVHGGRPSSPVDTSPSNMDIQHEQRGSSGFRRGGNQNSRFGREHEYHGDWSATVKENRQHNAPGQRERPRHGSHYEYQPVGPHSNNKTDNTEPPKDGAHNAYARYRERGQSHTRRGGGNFKERQSGQGQVDASYD